MTTIHAYAPIQKTERDSDGFLHVYGMATGPQLDLDGQICDPEWLKSAMPAWFDTGANVREMHQASAVGVGTELEADGDNHWLTAKVVDPLAATKTENGVYNGFSIGIKGPKLVKDVGAPNGRIVGGRIVEVSLVDRPCNEAAKLVLAKLATDDDDAELIEVEEVTKDDSLGGSVTTASEDEAVDLVASVIALIKQLLVGETVELANDEGTAYPVRILLGVLEDLECFVACDNYDDAMATMSAKYATSTEDALDITTLTTLVKAATADDATPEAQAEVAELRKALGLDELDEQINTIQTKTATSEDLTKVEDRLVKVETTVIEIGPRRAVQPAPVVSAEDERQKMVAKFTNLAATVEDRTLSAAYKQLAEQYATTV